MPVAVEDALTPGVSPKPLHPISRQLHDERSTGERLADEIAGHIGSRRFLIIQSIAVFCWISLNVIGLIAGWDPYPFVLLTPRVATAPRGEPRPGCAGLSVQWNSAAVAARSRALDAALVGADGDVVDRGLASPHQTARVELPVLVAV